MPSSGTDFGSCLSTWQKASGERVFSAACGWNESGRWKTTPAIRQGCRDPSPTRSCATMPQELPRSANRSQFGRNSGPGKRLGLFSAPVSLNARPSHGSRCFAIMRARRGTSRKVNNTAQKNVCSGRLRISPSATCSGELMSRGAAA